MIFHAVKIVRQKRPGTDSFLLRVPRHIAEDTPEDARFVAEAVDDGILFRVVREPEQRRPDWLAGGPGTPDPYLSQHPPTEG